MGRTYVSRLLGIAGVALVLSVPLLALAPKEARSALDRLVFVEQHLRVPQTPENLTDLRPGQQGTAGLRAFRVEHGALWGATLDRRRNVVTLLSGGAIPILPGSANALRWEDFGAGCRDASCLPKDRVEKATLTFLDRYQALLGVDPRELQFDAPNAGPVEHMYYATYRQVVNGIPVEGAALRFHVNRGNLVQVSTSRLAPVTIDTTPAFDAASASALLAAYLGGFPGALDLVSDSGSLVLVPVTPSGIDPDRFDGAAGAGMTHALAYRIAFTRAGVDGSWEALVDAHSGQILRFVDTNRYGRVHGGVYPGDGHVGAADRPFPYVQTGLAAPDDFADQGGRFPGNDATVSFTQGKYTWVTDFCGSNALTTTTGDADYTGWPDPVGMDCAVPSPNPGSTGNTMSSRTQYYQVTMVNIKARTYYPTNSWLNTNHMNVNVNQSPLCNANSGGGTINFYKAAAGCWNLGEIPGVSLHEWGHSWDDFDGSGGQSPPVESRADWTAAVQIHSSCIGGGFFWPTGTCSGYGDTCLSCSGIRDGDYWKHSHQTPWTAANNGTVYNCSPGSYDGPCGWEDHCESGIATQALWDMVKGPHSAPEPSGDFYTLSGLDIPSGWQLMDRLFWTSTATLDNMYNCTAPTSNGCTGDTLYNTFMAIDDDGDGVGNGTPHAAAIFTALNRHAIACGLATDAQNQNHASSACLALTKPQNLTTLGQNNQVVLSWNAVPNATRYEVLRNETDCGAGYTRVGTVTPPATGFTDDTVVNGITYYYRIQPFFDAPPACTGSYGPMSDCTTALPVPCQMPGTPLALTATPAGDNRNSLSWSNGSPAATSFNVYRAVGTCPGSGYTRIATGVTGSSYDDDPVSGQVTYAYAVTGRDDTALCETAKSNCSNAQTTGACTQAPVFAGITGVADPGSATCGLTLTWGAGTAYCGGPLHYNVYRSTTPGFTPGPGNLLANVSSTSYSDQNTLVSGTTYFYVVRAVDTANGVEEANNVQRSARPTGPPALGTFIDDAGDTEPAKMTFVSRCGGPISWAVSHLQNTTPGGGASYRSVQSLDADNPSGTVPDNDCSALVSPPLSTSTAPQISFWTRWDQEANWDGVVLEARVCGDPSCTTGTWQVITNAELEPDYPSTLSNAQTGNCNGAGACGDVFPYPSGDGIEWIDDCDYPNTTQAFTGTNPTFTHYTATLPPSFDNVTMQFRFNLSTDCAAHNSGSYVDDISVTNVLVPSTCATGSPCPGNPLVDVSPDGPMTFCPGSGQQLTATLSGGIAPFTYQWTMDGAPIAGANGPTYTASATGTHVFNCKVQGSGCSDFVFDPGSVSLNWQAAPSFGGLTSIANQSAGTCGLALSWAAATTPCAGGVTYSVYRSTATPVAVVPANRIAAGLTGTTYVDTEGLTSGVTYHYVVRAVTVATHAMDGNTVERAAAPSVTAPAFSDSFEGGNLGWTFTKGAVPATTGDFVIGDPVGTTNGSGQPSQPADDHTAAPGVNALYTAANPLGVAETDDVDKGEVVATSPTFNLSGFSAATLSVWRWFENETVGDSGDYYVQEVSNNNGSTWVQVEQIPDTVTNANAWTQMQSNLQTLVPLTSTMRLRFRVSDGRGPADLVEFAADDITVTGVCSAGPVGPPPVADGSGGTLPMTLTKGTGDQLQVTVDNATCQGHHVVILAGAIGSWGGYQWAPTGCAFAAGTGTGTITDAHQNAWYIAVWATSGGTGGSPGDASTDRTWPASGLCSVTGDDTGDQVCN